MFAICQISLRRFGASKNANVTSKIREGEDRGRKQNLIYIILNTATTNFYATSKIYEDETNDLLMEAGFSFMISSTDATATWKICFAHDQIKKHILRRRMNHCELLKAACNTINEKS